MRTESDTVVTLERHGVATPLEILPAELPNPAIERLHALVRKGYRPEIGTGTATDVILLRHLGKAPDLVLHSDGVVEPSEGRIPRYKRGVDAPAAFGDGLGDQLRFMKFLDSIPRPSLRDRTRRWRQKYIYFPAVFAVLLAIHLAFTAMIVDG
ncbi:MAG TPA: hypothetical protein VF504_02800 [Solirubrobacterales bacterium]